MISLIQMELLKLYKRPMTWLLLLLLLGILTLGNVANLLSWRRGDAETQAYILRSLLMPESLAVASQFIYQFGAILLAILAASNIGSEYSWGTLRQWLATGVSRTSYLLAKLIALALVGVGFVLISLVAMVPLSWVAAQTFERPMMTGSLDGLWLAALVARTTLMVLMPMTLAFVIGLATRSQALGVGMALGAMMADQIAAPLLWSLGTDWSLRLAELFPFWSARALLSYNFTQIPNEIPDLMQQGHATAVLVLYTVLCVAASLLIFRRRDVTGPV